MRAMLASLVFALCCGIFNLAHADNGTLTATNSDSLSSYKLQLFQDLDSGDILNGSLDSQTEISIAQTQLKLAQAYMNNGDRKLALILAILARQTMQRAIGNPYDPRMIAVYSTLVQLYDSQTDTDSPNTNQADATKSKAYREAIDHIHAE